MLRKLYSARQKITEYTEKKRGGNVHVYMFHQIAGDTKMKNLSITSDQFRQFVDRKLSEGMEFISPDRLKKLDSNRVYGMVTCDDMFMSAYENAIPYLHSQKIPFVCFISPGLLGVTTYIGKEELEILKKDTFCTVGAHGLKHLHARGLSSEDKKIEISKMSHEQLLGCETSCFAFPYGTLYACDAEARRIAAQQYDFCFSTFNYPFSSSKIEEYSAFIPRINVNGKNYGEL